MKNIAVRWLVNFFLMVVAFFGTLSLVEIGLRFTQYRDLLNPPILFPEGYFIQDNILGIDHASDFPQALFFFHGPAHDVFTNRYGCFDTDQPVGTDYVLVVGDSFTWGYTPLQQKWTSLLEDSLGARVLKCGVSGTGTKYQLLKAIKVIEKIGVPPKLIVVLHHENDLNDDVVFPGYTVVNGRRVNTLKSMSLKNGDIIRKTRKELVNQLKGHDIWVKKSTKHPLVITRLIDYVCEQNKGMNINGNNSKTGIGQFFHDGCSKFKEIKFSSSEGNKTLSEKILNESLVSDAGKIDDRFSSFIPMHLSADLAKKLVDTYTLNNKPKFFDNAQDGTPDKIMESRYGINLMDLVGKDYPWVEYALDQHINTMLNFRDLSNQYGAAFVVFELMDGHSGSRKDVRTVFERELDYYFDINAYINRHKRGSATLHPFNAHWNDVGNRLAAEGMYKFLKDSRLSN